MQKMKHINKNCFKEYSNTYKFEQKLKSIKKDVHYSISTNNVRLKEIQSLQISNNHVLKRKLQRNKSSSQLVKNKQINSPLTLSLIITNRKIDYSEISNINKTNFDYLILQFDITYIQNLSRELPQILNPLIARMKKNIPLEISVSQGQIDHELKELIGEIQTIISAPIVLNRLLNGCVQSLFLKAIHLLPYEMPIRLKEDDISFNKAKHLILQHLNKYPGQKKLQMAACMNRNYFTKIFKYKLGLTPHEYQIQKRREMAISKILNSDETLTSISDELGYTHPQALSRDIKNELGMSPQKIRESYNKPLNNNKW